MIKFVSSIDECKRLWQKFSPNETIWDSWDVSYAFFKEENRIPYFLVILDAKGEETGLLPLSKEKDVEEYFFFGGEYQENRKFWFESSCFHEIFENIPGPIWLFDLNGESAEEIIRKFPEYEKYFCESDFRFFLDIERLGNSIDTFFLTFGKKHKKNFHNDMKKLESNSLKIVWEKLEHFKEFVDFSVERFGSESDFIDDKFVKQMNSFLSYLNDNKMLHTLTILNGEKVEGIEMAAIHNDVYYVLNGGYNREVRNLGKLLILEHIKNAMRLKVREMDFLVGDTGWKELWNFEKKKCYTFKRKS